MRASSLLPGVARYSQSGCAGGTSRVRLGSGMAVFALRLSELNLPFQTSLPPGSADPALHLANGRMHSAVLAVDATAPIPDISTAATAPGASRRADESDAP